jgi:hypothetical protein
VHRIAVSTLMTCSQFLILSLYIGSGNHFVYIGTAASHASKKNAFIFTPSSVISTGYVKSSTSFTPLVLSNTSSIPSSSRDAKSFRTEDSMDSGKVCS